MKEKMKKILSVFLSIVLWAVILLAALYTFTTLATRDTNKVGRFLGYTPLSVLTESMEPTINAGDLILIKECDPSTLKEGDIITFETIIDEQFALNTHRIVEIHELSGFREYVTKGDNNQLADQHTIIDGDIVGKYTARIPAMGKVMNFLSSSIGFLVCIVLPMLIFFIYQVYNLVMLGMKLKKEEALEAAEEAARAAANAAKEAENMSETERLKAELEEAKRKLAEAEAKKDE